MGAGTCRTRTLEGAAKSVDGADYLYTLTGISGLARVGDTVS